MQLSSVTGRANCSLSAMSGTLGNETSISRRAQRAVGTILGQCKCSHGTANTGDRQVVRVIFRSFSGI